MGQKTPQELEAFRIYQAELQAIETTNKEASEAAAAQKVTDKGTGNQKLLNLGLTQAEVDALTG